jgi:AraC-like DNA-binding protein
MKNHLKKLFSPRKRIDKAIELLVHYNLTPIEIAYQLNYESAEEFENQFRIRVGYSPENFKQLILWDFENESGTISWA